MGTKDLGIAGLLSNLEHARAEKERLVDALEVASGNVRALGREVCKARKAIGVVENISLPDEVFEGGDSITVLGWDGVRSGGFADEYAAG